MKKTDRQRNEWKYRVGDTVEIVRREAGSYFWAQGEVVNKTEKNFVVELVHFPFSRLYVPYRETDRRLREHYPEY